jgi:adenylate cyclase
VKDRLREFLANPPIKRIDFALAACATLVGLIVFAKVNVTTERNTAGLSFIRNIETRSLDARFTLRGTRQHDEDIVIVGLDEKTLQEVGAFPIPRNAYAKMVDQLAKDGARIVAFDANFPVPEKNSAVDALKRLESEIGNQAPPAVVQKVREIEQRSDNDKIFADSIKRAGNVVLGHLFLDPERAKSVTALGAENYHNTLMLHGFPQALKVTAGRDFDLYAAWAEAGGTVAQGVYANIDILASEAKSFGFFDEVPDSDGTFRHALLLIRYADAEWYPSLEIETLRQAENIKEQSTAVYISENGVDRFELGPYSFKGERDGSVLINYAGPYRTYTHYSMVDVINGNFQPGTFKNKIVFFGATALAIGDIRNTPYATSKSGQLVSYMGVELHANVLDNLLHVNERGRGFLTHGFNEEMIDLLFILGFGAGLGYWFSKAKPLHSTFTAIAALALFAYVNYFAFAHFGMWLSFVVPAGTLVANYATITSFRMIFEEREKRKVRKTFERYVAPGVIALIEKDPKKYFKTGGESKELTVMFSDIRSFTTISEGLTPDELVRLLNEYLGDMTDILFRRWGTLDKYIGDAIMGFWGSPFPQDDHATRACACALDMRARLQELNMKWEAQGRRQLAIGVGLNTGEVNVGNMGSSKRFAWTVMGDNVNLASRLEGLNKEYGTHILISEPTLQAARKAGRNYGVRELDSVRVKGKKEPVRLFELRSATPQSSDKPLLDDYAEGLGLYRAQKFAQAQLVFEQHPDDGPSKVMIARCLDMAAKPPGESWDGVFKMEHK